MMHGTSERVGQQSIMITIMHQVTEELKPCPIISDNLKRLVIYGKGVVTGMIFRQLGLVKEKTPT